MEREWALGIASQSHTCFITSRNYAYALDGSLFSLANLSYLRAKSTGRSVNYNDLNKKSKRESEIEKKIFFQCIKNDLLRESITNSSKNFTK